MKPLGTAGDDNKLDFVLTFNDIQACYTFSTCTRISSFIQSRFKVDY